MPKLTVESLLELHPVIYSPNQLMGIVQEIERAQAANDDGKWLTQRLERYERQSFHRSAIGFGV